MRTPSVVLLLVLLFSTSAISAETVTFSNASTVLESDLLLPEPSACERCPALVFIHGSGSSARSNPWTTAWANALREKGVVVLHPDKRGSGQSAGDWKKASFETLAEDAIAAVNVLVKHPRVDPARLGVIGFSQGGHVAPLAAEKSDVIKLVLNVSGSLVPMSEQLFDEIRMDADKSGLSPEQVALLRDLHGHILDYAQTGQGWDQYEALVKEAGKSLAGTPFMENLPLQKDLWVWSWLKMNAGFDPLPHWKRLGQPALVVYGGQDENVDTHKSVGLLMNDLVKAHSNVSLLYLQPNGHAIFREDVIAFVAEWMRAGGAR